MSWQSFVFFRFGNICARSVVQTLGSNPLSRHGELESRLGALICLVGADESRVRGSVGRSLCDFVAAVGVRTAFEFNRSTYHP